jgi:RNA 2',3'-cyclic 3'-phosphodiesterase
MRLFIALAIDESIRERIQRFLEGVRKFAPDARWVCPESLHVTLKFIGEKSDDEVAKIHQVLSTIEAGAFEIGFRGYGFFPTPKSARIFWIGINASDQLPQLASTIDETLASIGISRENHAYSPHLTLARGGGGSGAPHKQKGDRANRSFQCLQEKLAALSAPEFGSTTTREFFLYQSQPGPSGARYTKIANFALK